MGGRAAAGVGLAALRMACVGGGDGAGAGQPQSRVRLDLRAQSGPQGAAQGAPTREPKRPRCGVSSAPDTSLLRLFMQQMRAAQLATAAAGLRSSSSWSRVCKAAAPEVGCTCGRWLRGGRMGWQGRHTAADLLAVVVCGWPFLAGENILLTGGAGDVGTLAGKACRQAQSLDSRCAHTARFCAPQARAGLYYASEWPTALHRATAAGAFAQQSTLRAPNWYLLTASSTTYSRPLLIYLLRIHAASQLLRWVPPDDSPLIPELANLYLIRSALISGRRW